MRCGWAVKGEGKKPKFGECVRARGRGESFTCSVHARRAKAGAFLDLAGEKRAKVGRCFRFPSSSFVLQPSGPLVAVDRWEEIGARYGHGFALWLTECGCNAHSTPRRKHSAQRRCEALCAVLKPFVRFYAFSRLRSESSRVFF